MMQSRFSYKFVRISICLYEDFRSSMFDVWGLSCRRYILLSCMLIAHVLIVVCCNITPVTLMRLDHFHRQHQSQLADRLWHRLVKYWATLSVDFESSLWGSQCVSQMWTRWLCQDLRPIMYSLGILDKYF